MNKKSIYFKSDFTVILESEAGWGGCPFRLSFYTASPSRSFVACFDGENYHNCRLLDDGRLEIAINQNDGCTKNLLGIGTLMCAPEFYLDNDAFRDHICNEFVKPFEVVLTDEDGSEYNVVLDLNGEKTLTTVGTLPAFYMKGKKGEKGDRGVGAPVALHSTGTIVPIPVSGDKYAASLFRDEFEFGIPGEDVEVVSTSYVTDFEHVFIQCSVENGIVEVGALVDDEFYFPISNLGKPLFTVLVKFKFNGEEGNFRMPYQYAVIPAGKQGEKGEKGDTPIITTQKDGDVTTIFSDGKAIGEVKDGSVRFEDLTPEQKAEIQKPAIEAANAAMWATDHAMDAAMAARNAVEQFDGKKATSPEPGTSVTYIHEIRADWATDELSLRGSVMLLMDGRSATYYSGEKAWVFDEGGFLFNGIHKDGFASYLSVTPYGDFGGHSDAEFKSLTSASLYDMSRVVIGEAGYAATKANLVADELIAAKNRGEFKGEKGDAGPVGPAGPQGPRGEKGDPGESIHMFPNVTIFGQPRIQESQISGFTANDYVQFPFLVDFAGRPWQIDCAITTGADVSQQHNVFDSAFGLAFAFASGKFVLAMSSNGTSWNLGATSGTHTIAANTTYYIRISWNGSVYKLAYSTDKGTWVDDIIVTSSASLASKQIIIGKSLDNRYIFNGSINMADAQLTIADLIVWEGMAEAGIATRMAIDMSNIDDEGKQRVNQIVNDGEVGQKLSELDNKIGDINTALTNIVG